MATAARVQAVSKTIHRAIAVQDVVIPRWWSGSYDAVVDPSRFVVNGGGKLNSTDCVLNSWVGQEIQEKYKDVGVIHIKNTGLTDMKDQRLLAKLVMGEETEYEGGANPRDRTEGLANVYDIGAPLQADLHYHHEMTYKSYSTESLGFLCKHAVTTRPGVGWTFVSDSAQAHDYIMETELGQKLKDKGLCFIRRMTDANKQNNDKQQESSGAAGVVYNHWQKSWMTNDPIKAEEAANAQGIQVEWIDHPTEGRIMQTRYYKSAFEYVPMLDRNIMVCSIADDGEWFDTWPGIMEIPQEERPMEMLFGDDEPFTLEEKQEWVDSYDRFGIPIPWQAGDVAVVCNMRFAHGRPGIHLLPGEKRELGVMLGPLFKRQETREGKW
jgi:hypothetical protein